jgi:hypothetical protein
LQCACLTLRWRTSTQRMRSYTAISHFNIPDSIILSKRVKKALAAYLLLKRRHRRRYRRWWVHPINERRDMFYHKGQALTEPEKLISSRKQILNIGIKQITARTSTSIINFSSSISILRRTLLDVQLMTGILRPSTRRTAEIMSQRNWLSGETLIT